MSHAAFRSMPKNRSHSSTDISVASKLALTPALLTRIEGGPNRSAHRFTSSATSSSPETSAAWNAAGAPGPRLSATDLPCDASRPQNMTAAPCSRNSSTIARPIPREPPVTMAVSPASDRAAGIASDIESLYPCEPHRAAAGALRVSRDHLHNQLGEGPTWDERAGELMWVDISRGHLHTWRPQTAPSPPPEWAAKSVQSASSDGMILAVGHEIIAMDGQGHRETVAIAEAHMPANRVQLLPVRSARPPAACTMSKVRHPGTAGLYCLAAGQPIHVISRTTLSNGIGWSPAGIACTSSIAPHSVFMFDFDASSGARRQAFRRTSTQGTACPTGGPLQHRRRCLVVPLRRGDTSPLQPGWRAEGRN